jgi:hypothetical protein
MKNYSFLVAVVLLISNCYGQQKKDTVMWFVGTWKNKTTFLVDSNLMNGAKGGILIINPKMQIEISTPGIDSYNKAMSNDIKAISENGETVADGITKEGGVSQAGLVQKTTMQLNGLREEYKELKVKNSDLELSGGANRSCNTMAQTYQEIVAFYEAHKLEKKYNLPPPPEADYFDCWSCNPQKQIDFSKKVEDYVALFAGEEREYMISALQILKDLNISLYVTSTPANTSVCAIDGYKLATILFWLSGRRSGMSKQLLKENINNYKAVDPVSAVCLRINRDANLLSASGDPMELFGNIASLYGKLYHEWERRLFKEYDYKLLSEVPLMFRISKQMALLTGSSDDGRLEELIYHTGHFKLTLEMDVKMGKNGGYIISHLKGVSKMIYEIDSVDCIHIVPDWKANTASGITNWNSVTMTVKNLEMITPKGDPPVYIGTKNYISLAPKLKLNFCRQPDDSVYLQGFNPDPIDKGIWRLPKVPPAKMGLMGADRIFCDIDDLQNSTAQMQAPALDKQALTEIEKLAADIHKNGVTADKMKKIQSLQAKALQPASGMVLNAANFRFAVNTAKDRILINQRFDAKQINPQLSEGVVYGYFTIQLEGY